MTGNKESALKGANTMKDLYGEDYYKRIGSKGGKKSKGGFTKGSLLARVAGRKGGKRKKEDR